MSVTGILIGMMVGCLILAVISWWRERGVRKRARQDTRHVISIVRQCDHKLCIARNYVFTYRFLIRQIRRDPNYDESFEKFIGELRRRH